MITGLNSGNKLLWCLCIIFPVAQFFTLKTGASESGSPTTASGSEFQRSSIFEEGIIFRVTTKVS